ncbi:MAG: hypothetical protein R2745_25845 [Vicinamibacterales bacterium]
MPSRSTAFRWLLAKEWRELAASRAWWVLLVLMGPLVGWSFISATATYAELSAYGANDGVGEIFSPLVGIWAPTFSAVELAAVFLLPFVAIRVVAGDRQSGALKIELQHPLPIALRMAAKAVVLLAGWTIAMVPALAAVLLWALQGGFVHVPSVLSVLAGHFFNAGITVGLACAAAAFTEHPATAAIVTLSVTVGTWILNFVAAVQGGLWEKAADYTPTAMVGEFQHGLVRADVVAAAIALTLFGLALSGIWSRLGVAPRRKAYASLAAAGLTAAALTGAAFLRPAWDVSENRMNSFPSAEEALLRTIRQPLRIEVHLAPEDPRRLDFERRVLSRLRRVVADLRVDYVSSTTSGLLEQASDHYGEIWYEMLFQRRMTRATTPESARDEIFELAGFVFPPEAEDEVFRGHPLAAEPRGARAVYYGLWPLLVAVTGTFVHRRQT